MMHSMQVRKDGMPKLISLYVILGEGEKSLPLKRPKINYPSDSASRLLDLGL